MACTSLVGKARCIVGEQPPVRLSLEGVPAHGPLATWPPFFMQMGRQSRPTIAPASGAADENIDECDVPVAMSSMSDPVFIAKEKGYKEGKMFTSKAHSGMVFKLESFSEAGAVFKQQRAEGLHGPELLELQASFDDLHQFQKTKRKLQSLLPPPDLAQFSVGQHGVLKKD